MMTQNRLFKYHTYKHRELSLCDDEHRGAYDSYVKYVTAKKLSVMLEYLDAHYEYDVIDDKLVRVTIDEESFSPEIEVYVSINIKNTHVPPLNTSPMHCDIVSSLGLVEGVDYYKIKSPQTRFGTPDGDWQTITTQSIILNDVYDSTPEIINMIEQCKSEGMVFVSYFDRILVYDNNKVYAKCRYAKAPPGLFNPHSSKVKT